MKLLNYFAIILVATGFYFGLKSVNAPKKVSATSVDVHDASRSPAGSNESLFPMAPHLMAK